MLVNLNQDQNVIFKGVEQRQGKNGPFSLVVLADMDNVEKFDFFLRDTVNVNGLVQGQPVHATFELSKRGYQTNVDLASITPLKK